MADGSARLQEQIDRLRQLPTMVNRAAPKVATEFERELERNIAAGVGPDGRPWPKTKEGKLPLRNAAAALSVKAIGSVVLAKLTGIEVKHHLGAVKGGIRRPILPTGRIPDPITKAIATVIRDEFKATMGGQR